MPPVLRLHLYSRQKPRATLSSGTIPVFALNREPALSDLIYDNSDATARWVADGLRLEPDELSSGFSFAIRHNNKIIGGITFSGYVPDDSAWISIYTTDKHWCTKICLKQIFGVAFNALKCRRLNALICSDNHASISLATRCGFVIEGKMRKYYSTGQDALVLGMLASECKFINHQTTGENHV